MQKTPRHSANDWRRVTFETSNAWPKVGRVTDWWVGAGPQGAFTTVSALADALNVNASSIAPECISEPPKSWKASTVVDHRVKFVVMYHNIPRVLADILKTQDSVKRIMQDIDDHLPTAPAPAEEENRPVTYRDFQALACLVQSALTQESRIACRLELQSNEQFMREIRDDIARKTAADCAEDVANLRKRIREEEEKRLKPLIRAEVTQDLTKKLRAELEPKLKSQVTRDLIAREMQQVRPAQAPSPPPELTPDNIRQLMSTIQKQVKE